MAHLRSAYKWMLKKILGRTTSVDPTDPRYPRKGWRKKLRWIALRPWSVLVALYISTVSSNLLTLVLHGGLLDGGRLVQTLLLDQVLAQIKAIPWLVGPVLGGIGLLTLLWERARLDLKQERLVLEQQEKGEQAQQRTHARSLYLEGVLVNYSSVSLPIGPLESGLSLQAIFQPLKLHRDPLAAESLVSSERRKLLGEQAENQEGEGRQPSPEVIAATGMEALEKSPQRRMVILGGPGTGKTTLLRHLMWEAARQAQVDAAAPLPIFIALPDLARSQQPLQAYLSTVVTQMGAPAPYAEHLWKAITEGQAFLCLDSLDEVAPAQRSAILEFINRDAPRYGGIWIIGSRFTEYKGGQFGRDRFTEWELQPLTPELRQDLAQRLLPLLSQMLQSGDTTEPPAPEVFVSALAGHQQAAAWGENPLLFSLAAVVYVQEGKLPETRVALYQQVISAILKLREPDQHWRQILEQMLAELALWVHQTKGRTFTIKDLTTFFLDQQKQPPTEGAAIAERIVRSGVLEVVAHQIYGFRHQTFQEYLAAAALANALVGLQQAQQESAWELAWSKRTYSRWTEVLQLLVGHLAQEGSKGVEIAQQWVRALLRQRETQDGDPGDLGLMLALKSLSEVAPGASIWRERNGEELEEAVVTAWASELNEAVISKRNPLEWRLSALAPQLAHLSIPVIQRAIDELRPMLNDPTLRDLVTNISYGVFQPIAKSCSAEMLVIMLHDTAWEVRKAAMTGLRRLDLPTQVKLLEEALEDEAQEVREEAANVFEKLRERAPRTLLEKALRDPVARVRREALSMLKKYGKEWPLKVLLQVALHDKDTSLRVEAMWSLKEMGERAPVAIFVRLLHDPNEEVRKVAASVLGDLGERAPVEPLLEALQDANKEVRLAAIWALGQLGKRAPIAALLEVLYNEDEEIHRRALWALEKLGERVPIEPVLAALHYQKPLVREAAVSLLRKQVERVQVEPLLEALRDEHRKVRLRAVEALGDFGARTPRETLIALLHNEDEEVRESAGKALRSYWEHVPIEELVKALHHEDPKVRFTLLRAFSWKTYNIPVELLIAAINDPDQEVCIAAIEALGLVRGDAPREALIKALQDTRGDIRKAAWSALKLPSITIPVEALLAALGEEEEELRHWIAAKVAALEEQAPIERLMAALASPQRNVRLGAAEAVRKLVNRGEYSQRSSHDPLERNEPVRARVARALQEQVPVERLISVLRASDWEVRAAAVRVLGKLGRRDQVERLVHVALHDPHESVQLATGWALRDLREAVPRATLVGEAEPRAPLLAALHHPASQVRAGAVWALGNLQDRTILEVVVAGLSDSHPHVRQTASVVLEELKSNYHLYPVDNLPTEDSLGGEARMTAIWVLEALGNHAPVELLLLALDDQEWLVRKAAIEALAGLGEHMPVEPVLIALRDWADEVRLAAVKALAHLGEQIPVDALRMVLADQDPSVRLAAIETLGKAGAHAPIDQLMELALSSPDADMRAAAQEALEGHAARIPLEPLLEGLNNSKEEVRSAALAVLGRLGERAPSAPLLQALSDASGWVRGVAAWALGRRAESAAAAPLVTALADEDAFVREWAVWALGQLGKYLTAEQTKRLERTLSDENGSVRQATSGLWASWEHKRRYQR